MLSMRREPLSKQLRGWNWNLWSWWVLANALGEGIGLGLTFALGFVLFSGVERIAGPIAVAGLAILAGTSIEGLVVGTAQWAVLRHPLARLSWQRWALVTASGAFLAWTLGMIPSTFFLTRADSGTANTTPMNLFVFYGLAALMGFALGPILGIPQWLALRHYVQKAGWWVLANAIAWAVGMTIVFIGIHTILRGDFHPAQLVIFLLFLLSAGGAVGAVHGFMLIWLIQSPQPVE
jgi:hypothetical protein